MAKDYDIDVRMRMKNETGKAFDEIQKDIKETEQEFKGMASAIDTAMGFVMSDTFMRVSDAMGEFGRDMMRESMDAADNAAQLEAVLKSTGEAAGVTAEMANDLASELSRLTTYEDDAVLQAENMLLTFTKIGKDVFPDATKIVLDMSTALGQDLKSSAIQVGKALNDPILGVTALRRVGVNFSDAQMDMVKQLVESGKVLEAQKFILEELQTEFEGSAEAAASTFGGALKQLEKAFGDLQETMGNALTENEAFQGMIDWATEKIYGLTDAFADLPEGVQIAIAGFILFGSQLGAIAPALMFLTIILPGLKGMFVGLAGFLTGTLGPALTGTAAVIGGLTIPIWAVIAAFGALIAVIYVFGEDALKSFEMLAIMAITIFWEMWEDIKSWVSQILAYIKKAFTELGRAMVTGIWTGYTSMWSKFASNASTLLYNLIQRIKAALGIASPSKVFSGIGENMAAGVGVGFEKGMSKLSPVFQASVMPVSGSLQTAMGSRGAGGISVGHVEYHGSFSSDEMRNLDRRHEERAATILSDLLG